ncbi:MAG: hypothetical protein LBM01_02425 [Christensenellaceae bacterium]|jgi:hypothetical protein|nr:hypothetical protein [Christensenellaceae bacterium]
MNFDPYSEYRDKNVLKRPLKKETPPKKLGAFDEFGLKMLVSHFSGMSDDKLMEELTKQIEKKRANGTLGDIEQMLPIIKPLLTPEQQKRLDKILGEVLK